MARLLQHVVEAPRPCSYLERETARLEHRVMLDTTAEELEDLLEHGWRRFGPDYFRPRCSPCDSCVPTRIPVDAFTPSKSQRRARRNVAALRAMLGPPRVDPARLELHRVWHAEREQARAWTPGRIDERDYFLQFAFPHPAGREIAYYDDEAGGRLVGVAICDETPRAWSLVYFFYDPVYARLSLGVANVVFSIELAKTRSIPYVYLGYRVTECPSLRYKATFRPREELVGRPGEGETPRWVRAP
jgi:arginyl-tRNA--protein-N-Asp/Glu arginylyltransferase